MAEPPKVGGRTVRELCANFPLSDDAKSLLRDDTAPKQYLMQLIERELFEDAIRFFAHALPKREAVWWSLRCAQGAYGEKPPAPAQGALRATLAWVTDPSEENRRATHDAGMAADPGTPAGCAALAAFFSGGSMAPEGQPVVPPGEFLTAHMVSCAITLSAVAQDPENALVKIRQYLENGINVASGKDRWKAPG